MTSTLTESRPWSGRRWIAFSLMVFIVQLVLIFWLSDRRPLIARAPAPAPQLRFAGEDGAELLALLDPTLFALPSPHSFSGKAWLHTPPVQFRALDWSEPITWLPLQTQQLGTLFSRFVQTNRFGSPQILETPAPQTTAPDISIMPLTPDKSDMRIVGGLSGRPLLTPISLSSWPHTEMLTNTVIQLVVNAMGIPHSVTLLSGCGLREADDAAVSLARDMRFEPMAGVSPDTAPFASPNQQWGQAIFAWQTLPMPDTNSPAPTR